MHKRVTLKLSAAAAALLAIASLGAACGSSASVTPAATAGAAKAAKPRLVSIVMADPGCHWFHVAGKNQKRLVVHGATAFRNLDEAALVVKRAGSVSQIAVGKTLTVSKPGTYQITMVGQAPDDNHLKLVVT